MSLAPGVHSGVNTSRPRIFQSSPLLLFLRCDVAGLTVILMVCCDHAECAMSKTYENVN